MVFNSAGHCACDQCSDQTLHFPLIRFCAEGRGQYPALFRSPSEHQFLLVSLDAEPGEGLLVEEQHFLVGGVLSVKRFFLWKFYDIEIKAESGQYERHDECRPLTHRSRVAGVWAKR